MLFVKKTMQVLSDNSSSITAISIKFLGSDCEFSTEDFFFLSETTFLEFIRIFCLEIQTRKKSKPQKCSKFIEIEIEIIQ